MRYERKAAVAEAAWIFPSLEKVLALSVIHFA